jgi:membrane protease YdiL (CAAX protease family)
LVILSGLITQMAPCQSLKIENSILLEEMLRSLHNDPILLVLTCLTAGVVEEFIFRGYLIPRLNIVLNNKYLPVIISALCFGAFHYNYGTIINIADATLTGLIFGFYYQKYRNLKILVSCHFFIDFFNLI